MKPEYQRIEIAAACGKKVCAHRPNLWEHLGPEGDSELYCTVCKDYLSNMRLPDYLHDLNAMAEAERWLARNRPELENRYDRELARVTNGLNTVTCAGESAFYVSLLRRASATHRAEAFLRTIGKWTDDAEEQTGNKP